MINIYRWTYTQYTFRYVYLLYHRCMCHPPKDNGGCRYLILTTDCFQAIKIMKSVTSLVMSMLNTEKKLRCKLSTSIKCSFLFPCSYQQDPTYSASFLNHLYTTLVFIEGMQSVSSWDSGRQPYFFGLLHIQHGHRPSFLRWHCIKWSWARFGSLSIMRALT